MANFQYENTVIFLDFDDTLFPSTWFSAHKNDKSELVNPLKKSTATCISLIEGLSEYGTIYIVTNGNKSWFESVVYKMCPAIGKLIDKLHIDVIFAQDQFPLTLPETKSAIRKLENTIDGIN